jgi:hypothetical protein
MVDSRATMGDLEERAERTSGEKFNFILEDLYLYFGFISTVYI